eukprot:TRINITY_DN34883_c0_g1_i1.p1 TRINITY_DN34883_c0_g1~~TRINITY_DN34883_c0_g1_i1.p1  ORF type:complete len:455 (-),score=92.65 TRINITY_DN34883_c0_g1_i1:127-1491(-)
MMEVPAALQPPRQHLQPLLLPTQVSLQQAAPVAVPAGAQGRLFTPLPDQSRATRQLVAVLTGCVAGRSRRRIARRALQPYAIEPINPFMMELKATARCLSTPDRGLLDAAIFDADFAAERRAGRCSWRGLPGEWPDVSMEAWLELVCQAEGLGDCFSGVALQPDALTEDIVNHLKEEGVCVGARADSGFYPLNGYGEKGTQGLLGLAERCKDYYLRGARFAHWRTDFECSDELPTDVSLWESCAAMAEFAKVCQAHGLVPALEVLIDSSSSGRKGRHSVERSAYVAEKIYSQVVQQLLEQDVNPEAVILMPSFCLAGADAPPATPSEVANATALALWRTVPAAFPGLRLLSEGPAAAACGSSPAAAYTSGGHEQAAEVLEELATSCSGLGRGQGCAPWDVQLFHGAALLCPVLEAWGGDAANAPAARSLLFRLAKNASQATARLSTPAAEGVGA